MSGEPVLAASHVSKSFCKDLRRSLRYGVADMLREVAGRSPRPTGSRPGEFLALDDVSLSVMPGEAVAVLGHNGAGKSTLLKILNGLLKPNGGEVRIAGRIGALIELGIGFDPLLTGRENILLACAIHGFPATREIDLVANVVDFSELGDLIHAAYQTYSSGMKARLAFSTIAMMRPDLLLIDEVLAVGDHAFQRKCVSFLQAYLKEGGALLFVSHNGHQVQAVCERAVLLDHGRLVFSGSSLEALHRMYELTPATTPEAGPAVRTGPVTIQALSAIGPGGGKPRARERLDIALEYRADAPMEAHWAVTIWSADGWVCITSVMDERLHRLEAGQGFLNCTIPHLPLTAGRYLLTAAIVDSSTLHPLARFGHEQYRTFLDVTSPPSLASNLQQQRGQLIEMNVEWR